MSNRKLSNSLLRTRALTNALLHDGIIDASLARRINSYAVLNFSTTDPEETKLMEDFGIVPANIGEEWSENFVVRMAPLY